MIEIKDLLARFETLLVGEEVKKQALQQVLESVIGVKIKSGDIKVTSDTVYLNIKPIYKSEIFLKKEEINKLLDDTLGKKVPRNLR